jgi:2-isopropylmalate synthase
VALDVEGLARAIRDEGLSVAANCAARTLQADIAPIVRIAHRTGVPIECCVFIGSSPIRQYVEGWTLDHLQRLTDEAVRLAVREGLQVMYVAEDTTRADPRSLAALFQTATRAGASRLCLADTVGHATPVGAAAVVRFTKRLLDDWGATAGLDWHGHQDRGLGVACALAAVDAGVTRVHGTALGIGERAGNTPIDQLLVNLVMAGYDDRDLSTLPAYCEAVSRACEVPIPANYPVLGADAFRTATGVHAAAVLKASKKHDRALVDAVYAAVPASLVGREQVIDVGPVSGRSNVIYWLERHGLAASEQVVDRVLAAAKRSNRTLTQEQILEIVSTAASPGA